jgi:hypothetical protein
LLSDQKVNGNPVAIVPRRWFKQMFTNCIPSCNVERKIIKTAVIL